MNSSHTTESMIITRALEWLLELEDQATGPLSAYAEESAKLRDFAQWFLESPRHQDAFIEAMAISAVSRRFDVQHKIDIEQLLSAPSSNVVPFKGEPSACHQREHRTPREVPARNRFPATMCASLLVLLAIPLVTASLRALQTTYSWPAYYTAGIGERRFVPLEDGSTVELNTRSSIEVDVSSHGRKITLLSGEAIFNVRHDDAHPFRVVSDGIEIRDVGTTFAVQRQASGATTVSVVEGRVEISTTEAALAGRTAILPVIVEAQHSADISISGRRADLKVQPATAAELARRLAWRDGHVVFMGETLAEVVEKLNRYHHRQMRIVDPTISSLVIGGVFTTTDLDGFIDTITQLFNVRAVPAPRNANVIELKRRQESQ